MDCRGLCNRVGVSLLDWGKERVIVGYKVLINFIKALRPSSVHLNTPASSNT